MQKTPRTRFTFATIFIATCAVSTVPTAVFAHDGHGLLGSHWHSTDVLGFVALGCVVGLALWLSRGKR
jgi:hypothetical protein